MLHIQKYLKTHTLEQLKDEFEINFKEYDDRVVLKYGIQSKPKFHPLVLECRGIVLSLPDYRVLARGFDRFFNYGEGDDHLSFNWDNCIVFNKLDGSLCKVYHDGTKWCVSTNGTAFAEGETPMGKTYHDLFVEAIGGSLEDKFNIVPKSFTYIFELTSPENRIVTRYNETKATLLAVRDNDNGCYVGYEVVERNMDMLPFTNLVESYDINDAEDVLKFVESRDALDEGVVLYDVDKQMRIKVKNSAYVAIHRLKGEGEDNIKGFITLVFKQEQDEFLLYFPEYTDVMLKYVNAYNGFKLFVNELWNNNKHIENQKEFALKVKDTPVSGILFGLKKGLLMDDLIQNLSVNRKIDLLNKFL